MTEAQLIRTREGAEHYDLLEAIESDALAEAWFARTPPRRTGPALVRVLRPQPAVCADVRSRDAFLEALLAQSAVRHPLLVRVLDISSRDRPYAVFELVEAIRLEELLAGARETNYPVSLAAVLRITLDVAAALDAVHVAGLAHGDVTSRSVLLAASGFGLLSPTGLGVAACRLRRELVTPGLAYKPKEQLERAQLSPAGDVFALGALVFEMLAGRPVFEGEGAELLAALSEGRVPRLDDVRSGIARPFADVVARALATQPGDRFATASAFATELETAAGPALAARADLGRLVGRLAAQDLAALRMTLTPLVEARESLASFPAREELEVPTLLNEPQPVTEASPKVDGTAPAAAISPALSAGANDSTLVAETAALPRRAPAGRIDEPSIIIKEEPAAPAKRTEPAASPSAEATETVGQSDRTAAAETETDAAAAKSAAAAEPAPSSAPAVASIVVDTDDEVALLARDGAARKRRVIGTVAVAVAALAGFAVVSQLGSPEPPSEPDKAQPAATLPPAAAAPAPIPVAETKTEDFESSTTPPASASAESSAAPRRASAAPRKALPARATKDAVRGAPRPASKPATAPRSKIPTGI